MNSIAGPFVFSRQQTFIIYPSSKGESKIRYGDRKTLSVKVLMENIYKC